MTAPMPSFLVPARYYYNNDLRSYLQEYENTTATVIVVLGNDMTADDAALALGLKGPMMQVRGRVPNLQGTRRATPPGELSPLEQGLPHIRWTCLDLGLTSENNFDYNGRNAHDYVSRLESQTNGVLKAVRIEEALLRPAVLLPSGSDFDGGRISSSSGTHTEHGYRRIVLAGFGAGFAPAVMACLVSGYDFGGLVALGGAGGPLKMPLRDQIKRLEYGRWRHLPAAAMIRELFGPPEDLDEGESPASANLFSNVVVDELEARLRGLRTDGEDPDDGESFDTDGETEDDDALSSDADATQILVDNGRPAREEVIYGNDARVADADDENDGYGDSPVGASSRAHPSSANSHGSRPPPPSATFDDEEGPDWVEIVSRRVSHLERFGLATLIDPYLVRATPFLVFAPVVYKGEDKSQSHLDAVWLHGSLESLKLEGRFVVAREKSTDSFSVFVSEDGRYRFPKLGELVTEEGDCRTVADLLGEFLSRLSC